MALKFKTKQQARGATVFTFSTITEPEALRLVEYCRTHFGREPRGARGGTWYYSLTSKAVAKLWMQRKNFKRDVVSDKLELVLTFRDLQEALQFKVAIDA